MIVVKMRQGATTRTDARNFGSRWRSHVCNLEYHWLWPASKGSFSVLRNRPWFRKWLSNQDQIKFGKQYSAARKGFREAKIVYLLSNGKLTICQYPSLLFLFLQLEKLEFSFVSTEAGHEPFFLVRADSTHRDLSKNDFFEILPIFFGPRQNLGPFFWQIFDFGKSARTNWKIYLIPTYSDGFRTFKKSLSVPINRSINLLPLAVRNCSTSNVYLYLSVTSQMFSKKGYQDPEHNSRNNDRLMIGNQKQLKRSFYGIK